MFDKIIPPEKGPATWFSRDVKRVLFLVFAILGRSVGVIAVGVCLFVPFRSATLLVLCITVVVAAGSFIVIGEYFRDEDGT